MRHCGSSLLSLQLALPRFTGGFLAALKKLESPANDRQKRAYFKEFYETYGTHFITEARFGAKLIVQTKYNKKETSSSQLNEAKKCGGLSVGMSYGPMKGDASVDACSEAKSENKQGKAQSTSSSTVISIGSKPTKDTLGE